MTVGTGHHSLPGGLALSLPAPPWGLSFTSCLSLCFLLRKQNLPSPRKWPAYLTQDLLGCPEGGPGRGSAGGRARNNDLEHSRLTGHSLTSQRIGKRNVPTGTKVVAAISLGPHGGQVAGLSPSHMGRKLRVQVPVQRRPPHPALQHMQLQVTGCWVAPACGDKHSFWAQRPSDNDCWTKLRRVALINALS